MRGTVTALRRVSRVNLPTLAALLALLMAISPALFAQEASGGITGKVTDPSGAAVVGADVVTRDVDRGTVWTTKTNEGGVYNFARLPIGRYEVKVQATGFQAALRTAFPLELNQTAKIDLALALGAVSQQVEVSDAVPALQTQTTEVSTVMQANSIANLPLATRNYNQLTLLIPGAVTISPASFNTGLKTFNAARPNLNGNREQANYYLLDGIENTEFVDNNVAYSPNVDAIQEFSVITNNPNAEFGQFLGGVINVSLKSGTNQIHGNLFEYLRNDFFNANEWSNNFNGLPTRAPALERVWRHGRRPHPEKQVVLLRGLPGVALRPARHLHSQDHIHCAECHRGSVRSRRSPALSGHQRTDAGESHAGGRMHRGAEDGRGPLHQRPEPDRAENRRGPAEAQFARPRRRHCQQLEQRGAELYARQPGRYQNGLGAYG